MNRIYCALGKIVEVTQFIEVALGEICEKSGMNINLSPSPALGSNNGFMQNMMSNKKSMGIRIFDIFSIFIRDKVS